MNNAEIIIQDSIQVENVKKTVKMAKLMMNPFLKNHGIVKNDHQIEKFLFEETSLSVHSAYLAMILSDSLLYSLWDRIKNNKKINLNIFNEKILVLNFLNQMENSFNKEFRVLSNRDVVQVKKMSANLNKQLPMLLNDSQKEVKIYLSKFYDAIGYKIKNIPK